MVKTIDDIRRDLRIEKEKTRKLRKALATARSDAWLQASILATDTACDYGEMVFPAPGPDSSPECYSAAGARLAAGRIAKECMRRAKETR